MLAFGNPMLDVSHDMSLDEIRSHGLLPDTDACALNQEAKRGILASVLASDDARVSAGGSALNTMRAAKWVLTCSVNICAAAAAAATTAADDATAAAAAAATAATAATTQHHHCSVLGAVGTDAAADILVAACADAGVEPLFLRVPGEPTGVCAVLVSGALRTLVGVKGAHKHYAAAPLVEPLVEAARRGNDDYDRTSTAVRVDGKSPRAPQSIPLLPRRTREAERLATASILLVTCYTLTNECRTEAAAAMADEARHGTLRGPSAPRPDLAVCLSSATLMADDDVVSRLVRHLLPAATFVFCNRAEAEALFGHVRAGTIQTGEKGGGGSVGDGDGDGEEEVADEGRIEDDAVQLKKTLVGILGLMVGGGGGNGGKGDGGGGGRRRGRGARRHVIMTNGTTTCFCRCSSCVLLVMFLLCVVLCVFLI